MSSRRILYKSHHHQEDGLQSFLVTPYSANRRQAESDLNQNGESCLIRASHAFLVVHRTLLCVWV